MENRLVKLDQMIGKLLKEQDDLAKELSILRDKGETKSYKFRELLGRKLINSAIIEELKSHELM